MHYQPFMRINKLSCELVFALVPFDTKLLIYILYYLILN